MAGENTKNFREQGGERVVIGGVIDVAPGAKITADGVQAAAIADPTGGATTDAEARAAIDDILAALRGVGIIAAS